MTDDDDEARLLYSKGEGEEDVFEQEDEKDSIRPPKIWISKSASMEHDLD